MTFPRPTCRWNTKYGVVCVQNKDGMPSIRAVSEFGRGSVFPLTLPFNEQEDKQ